MTVQNSLTIKNIVELYNFVLSIRASCPHFDEFCRFVEDIDNDKCNCNKSGLINRAINYYRSLPNILTQQEIDCFLQKNNNNSIILQYQTQNFHVFTK